KTADQIAKEYAREENREMRTIREAHMMMLLRHPNIVGLKDLVVAGSYFYILMDYVNGGQLLHHIVKHQRLSEKRARSFARQIASAVDYMHRNSIVHRDLKIENIMIDKSGRKLKIIDFGLSNLFCPERQLTTYCGSLYFAAPELLCATPYNGPEVDIWSIGVVIYVMVTGFVPFDDKSMPGLHEKIKQCQVTYPRHLGEGCLDLLRRIFVPDPNQRIYLADILLHPWMNLDLPPIQNYLPARQPLSLPLDQHIIKQMSHGMNLGSEEEISNKLNVIVQSPVYRDAATLVREHQTKPLSSDLTQPPFYDDPQSIPAAYHPLTSVYHLTVERQSYLQQQQQTKKPVSLVRKSSVDSVSSIGGGLSSTLTSQVSLVMIDDDNDRHQQHNTIPLRRITDIPLGNMVRPSLTSRTQASFASTDYLSKIQRWLRSSTSQHHLDEPTNQHTTASPLTTHVTNADEEATLWENQSSLTTAAIPIQKTPTGDQTPLPAADIPIQATPVQARSLIRKLSLVVLRRGVSNKSNTSNHSGSSLRHATEQQQQQKQKPTPIRSSSIRTPLPSTTYQDRPLPPLPAQPKTRIRLQRSSSSTSIHNLSAKIGALLNRSSSFNKRQAHHNV
ncbi:kinase-like domain-containing protein, partial [Chlamydoabsidia padenii]